jgi:hypothetical protein
MIAKLYKKVISKDKGATWIRGDSDRSLNGWEPGTKLYTLWMHEDHAYRWIFYVTTYGRLFLGDESIFQADRWATSNKYILLTTREKGKGR